MGGRAPGLSSIIKVEGFPDPAAGHSRSAACLLKRRKTMKARTRTLSLLLALLMLLSLGPELKLPAAAEPEPPAAEADPAAAPPASDDPAAAPPAADDPNVDTDMTIDFDFEKNNHVTDAASTLWRKGDEAYFDDSVNPTDYQSLYSQYRWNHVTVAWKVKDNTPGSLRYYLNSTEDEHTYIVLDWDDNSKYHKQSVWEPMTIRKDKVLDLNGHTLNIHYDANRKNDSTAQTTHEEYHNCVAFEIEDGATLTIIDSSAWRGANGGKGTGRISFTGYMVDPYSYDINYYTTRDLFHVDNGNLVIYGGEFQAGRKKDQLKSNFSWRKLRTVIGNAVELGVNISEYATGINVASAAYASAQSNSELKKETNMKAFNETGDTGDDDGTDGSSQTMVDRNGTNLNAKTKDTKLDTANEDSTNPGSGREQTVDERKVETDGKIASGAASGTQDGENKATADGKAKDDSQTKVAKAQKDVVDKIVNKSALGNIVDGAFDLVEGIIGMCGKDEQSRVTQSIKGTVVRVGGNGTFVAYGGTFLGYGSTPNTRNAVVECVLQTSGKKSFDHRKYQGGLVYIYGGTFEGYNGANIFNMINITEADQYAIQRTRAGNGVELGGDQRVKLEPSETGNVEVLYYEKQDEINQPGFEHKMINTSNVQVRGGTFRCFYDMMNVALKQTGDSEHFTKFPGTSGCVNLGVESYGENLIQDGRIQIVDRYGAGALVLLDDRTEEKNAAEAAGQTYTEGLYHYRLFCGDTELRCKYYLEVSPNTARTNAAYSMQLATYYGSGKRAASLWVNNEDNIRAASRQTENFFDFEYDDPQSAAAWSVMPNFYHPADDHNELAAMDPYGEYLNNSEVWYYPQPMVGDNLSLGDTPYAEYYYEAPSKSSSTSYRISQWRLSEGSWDYHLRNTVDVSQVDYRVKINDGIRTTMKYFTYKLYRVDPLTRENISESGEWGVDKPLLTVRYGSVDEQYLKCKLPLLQAEAQIQKEYPDFHYESGGLYRIVLEVEEYLCAGYIGGGFYGQQLPVARAESTILFRCLSVNEKQSNGEAYLEHDYTPVQWLNEPKAGQTASVRLVNAKAGMTDYWGDSKVFDVYYQWYEVDKNGNNPRLIAGTDNVYNRPTDDLKPDHRPMGWDILHDGKQYVNTVDPNDPNAASYKYHGLPGTATTPNPIAWTPEMIHLYSRETTDPARYKKDKGLNLCLGNNDVFETGVDNCYIPEELAGKYIQVKVIVLNYKWPAVYDKKQTFKSHVYHIPSIPQPLKGKTELSYASGVNYAAPNRPMTVKLTGLSGLGDDEYITEAWYYVGATVKGYENLNVTAASQLPTLSYPKDFYADGYDYTQIRNGQKSAWVYYETNKGRSFSAPIVPFNYEIEATGYRIQRSSWSFNRSEVENGKADGQYHPFKQVPSRATVGYDYVKDSSTTDRNIAYLDANGYLVFGGKCGTATVTIKGKDKVTKTATVTIINDFDHIEIGEIQAPARGQKLNFNVSVPDDAPYTVQSVNWMYGNGWWRDENVDQNLTAENFETYTIGIKVKAKPGNWFNFKHGSYTLTINEADGGARTVNSVCVDNPDVKEWETGVYYFYYTFPMIGADIPTATIHEVHISYPTEVAEGTSWDDWIANSLQVASDGYDEHYTIKAYPTYADTAEAVLNAHGSLFKISSNMTGSRASFLKGVQTGIYLELEIDTSEYQDRFADYVDYYLNGEKVTDGCMTQSNHVYINLKETLEVVDGKIVEPMPKVYPLKAVNWVTGTTSNLNVNDLTAFYTCDDPGVSFSFSAPYPTNADTTQSVVDSFLSFDPEALTLVVQPVVAGNAGRTFGAAIDMTANFDQDGDGKPELQEVYTLPITHDNCFYYTSSVPAAQTRSYTFKFYNSDWELVDTVTRSYTGGSGYLSLPELEDHFVWAIRKDGVEYDLMTSYGLGRIGAPESGTYEILTVSATGNVEVWPGVNDVYVVTMDDDSGAPLPHIQISVDGVHFMERNYLDGLEPDTNYMLYYRQGIDGKVYSKLFRTGSVDYGVRVGLTPITDANCGNLDVYAWEYDPATKNLTLRNMDLCLPGGFCGAHYSEWIQLDHKAVIYADHDLTLTVLGENWIERIPRSKEWIENNCIYVKGNLTLKGSGNLTLRGGNYHDDLLYSETGNITVAMGGLLTAEEGFLFSVPNGKVFYQNGEIDFTTHAENYGTTDFPVTNLIPLYQTNKLDLSGRVHNLTIVMTDLNGNSANYTVDQFLTEVYAALSATSKKSVHLTPNHSFNQKVAAYEYLYSGSCVSGGGQCRFYYACACGAKGTSTYTQTMSGHSMTVSHAGRAATCTLPGWDAYSSCAVCNYYWRNYYPATGHNWQKKAAKQPSCTADGYPAYEVCTRCGLSSQAHIPTDEEVAQGSADPELVKWKATGHSYRRVTGTPATCTVSGSLEHYVCDRCGKLFAHQGDQVTVTQAELPIAAPGHSWGPWQTVNDVKQRSCARCGETQTDGTPVNPFVDVTEGKYYYKAVLWAYYHDPQVTGGTDATHFGPGKNCTREQIVTFLWKAAGAPEPTSTVNPFTDVKAGKYYYKAVLWAVENNITGGVSSTLFGVGRPCTREQTMTFLWKAVGSPNPTSTTNPFTDVKEGKYYYKAVLWAVENGVTGGVSSTLFGVGRTCTRGQIVTFLYAAIGKNE